MARNTSTDKLTRLEEEGELTADCLEGLLDIAGLDGDIEINMESGRTSVEIISEHSSGLDRLVGENGGILDVLQEFTRLTVQAEIGERSRLILDVAGLRAERKTGLQGLTVEAITRLRATGETQEFKAMNPFKRKVCHDVVAEEGFLSESEGAEPHRCVVILPTEEDEVEEVETEESEGE